MSSMTSIIKKITIEELDRVCEILASVIIHMNLNGLDQWGEDYPTRDILSDDIVRGDLFGVYIDEMLTGFVALNNHQSEEYYDINWKFNEPCLVVHRLQVDPLYHGQSIAYNLMLFAETYGKDQNYKSIRLDTRCDNKSAIGLYEKLQYKSRGHVHFPRMMEYNFICFEKRIL